MKCLPQLLGLVRGESKPGSKHRANGEAIAKEAGNERYSKSNTLDRTRSHLNEYRGYRTGADCWADMEAAADEYRVTGVSRSGKEFSRKLRGDAVIGWAMIIHPPESVTVDWPPEKHKKFANDSWNAMKKIEPRLFRIENLRMLATHKDEGGEHNHFIGDAKDEDGKYCGNLIDAALMVKICKEYPALMRKKGWDVEDPELTDFKRMGKNEDGTYKDPEYRAKVKARKKGGLSVNDYAEQQAKEQRDAAARMYDDAQNAIQTAQNALHEAQAEADEIILAAKQKAKEEALEVQRAAKEELQERERRVARLETAAENLRKTVALFQRHGLLHEDQTPKTRDELHREFLQERQDQRNERMQQRRGFEFDL